jgi:threonine/homoserine/homoserine lactone efflux protein
MIETLAPMLLFVAVAALSPGGATTLATASGLRFGYRRSLPLIGGIAAGMAALSAASAIGLASLMLSVPSLQLAMKVIGSAYLLWLAWKIGRSGPPKMPTAATADLARPTSFIGGICLLLLNPKGWAMTLSAAASFAALARTPWQLAMLLSGAFCVAAILSLSLWCLTGSLLARLLRTERQWRVLNVTLGLLLAASIVPMWLD